MLAKMDVWLEQWSPSHSSQLTFKAFVPFENW